MINLNHKGNESHSVPHVATTTNTSTGLNEHQESFKEQRKCNLNDNDKCYTTNEETDNTITETDTSQITTMNKDNTSATSHPQSFNTPITPANDPLTWRHLSKAQKEKIIQNGPP